MLESREQRRAALFPQILDDLDQRAVVRRFGDAQVKHPIGLERRRAHSLRIILHLLQCIADCGDLRALAFLRGNRRAFPFDRAACVDQFEWTGLLADTGMTDAVGTRRSHINAGADADFDQPFDFERNERLAHRRSRYAQLLGKIALRRQASACGVFTGRDEAADLLGDLAI